MKGRLAAWWMAPWAERVSRTARWMAAKIFDACRNLTSCLVGWALTSTISAGTCKWITAMGRLPTGRELP